MTSPNPTDERMREIVREMIVTLGIPTTEQVLAMLQSQTLAFESALTSTRQELKGETRSLKEDMQIALSGIKTLDDLYRQNLKAVGDYREKVAEETGQIKGQNAIISESLSRLNTEVNDLQNTVAGFESVISHHFDSQREAFATQNAALLDSLVTRISPIEEWVYDHKGKEDGVKAAFKSAWGLIVKNRWTILKGIVIIASGGGIATLIEYIKALSGA